MLWLMGVLLIAAIALLVYLYGIQKQLEYHALMSWMYTILFGALAVVFLIETLEKVTIGGKIINLILAVACVAGAFLRAGLTQTGILTDSVLFSYTAYAHIKKVTLRATKQGIQAIFQTDKERVIALDFQQNMTDLNQFLEDKLPAETAIVVQKG
ncbi:MULTISPECIES: hypothetical protein [Loigolactobacillus]|uniref:Uncharacterized protein n=1 Tax=Loigolactobacillus backii TaxID=375175 RepID=A0A192GZL7_9LACO|nr:MULTISPECIES: hypothetical protein [Loigolactobacillus]ANK58855.1 hypothetical protein AYR52_00395 [Loigolactobacillus backii]ANK61483.1 hypothetical protein AYR53_01120 [Loigolactobacillus backii]ANK63845.1 hypothetical protein AYR54_00390 [Loigolactobacillus backii]ANK66293.1 hypothetical protein AYR55_00390 [Loigolactobacillus backii]ANK69318.1 hypothetical protein AYR56_03595 [Loigolactobacillus backii]